MLNAPGHSIARRHNRSPLGKVLQAPLFPKEKSVAWLKPKRKGPFTPLASRTASSAIRAWTSTVGMITSGAFASARPALVMPGGVPPNASWPWVVELENKPAIKLAART